MGFQQGLSGLNASSKSLEVIGNNIANASTIGAKASRAEFADVYANAIGGSNAVGIGVMVADVAQQFTQGDNVYFPDESHLNERGQAVVADALAAYLAPQRRVSR